MPPPPFQVFQSFESPWQGAPGPMPPPQNIPGPAGPAAALFPTSNLKAGDVVNVTGSFQGLHQGQVRVKFAGAPWQAPSMQGPFSASVLVPQGAETGECLIEVNGRIVFGRQCSVVQERFAGAKPRDRYGAWEDFGEKSRMGSYVTTTESRGVGAIASLERAKTPGDGEIIMRRRAESAISHRFRPGRSGSILSPARSRDNVVVVIPRRGTITDPRFGPPRKVSVTVTTTPGSFSPAGVMPGGVAPGLSTAVDHQNSVIDEELEEIMVPEVPWYATDAAKWAGLGLGALALLYMLTRK